MPEVKQVGIYLGCRPGSGGMFQYCLSMLDALAALPSDRFRIIAAYEDSDWQPYLVRKAIFSVPLGQSVSLGKWWSRLCLPLMPWKAGLWRFDRIARFFASSDMDIWIFPAQDHWTYLSRISAIGVVHDLMHRYEPEFPEVSSFGRRFLRNYRFRNLCRAARCILVDSETGKQHVMESYGVEAAKIHPLPYIPPDYISNAPPPDDFNTRYRLPPKYFFYPAQFWAHKNHIRLLQALSPGMQLVLAGPKDHAYEKVAAEVKRLGLTGAVHFIGYVPDEYLSEIYRRARALVMPSFFGPTNIPPLEAQLLGCPVAISGTYGMPEQSGNAALYFDPRSVPEISGTLQRLWTDDALCLTLRENGQKRVAGWGQVQFNARVRIILDNLFISM